MSSSKSSSKLSVSSDARQVVLFSFLYFYKLIKSGFNFLRFSCKIQCIIRSVILPAGLRFLNIQLYKVQRIYTRVILYNGFNLHYHEQRYRYCLLFLWQINFPLNLFMYIVIVLRNTGCAVDVYSDTNVFNF